jgi:hypothetical protein
MSKLSVAPKATPPEALTLADVRIVREGIGQEALAGRDLAIVTSGPPAWSASATSTTMTVLSPSGRSRTRLISWRGATASTRKCCRTPGSA